MKTVLKVIAWILAIIVGLGLIVTAVGLIFFARNRGFYGGMMNFPRMMRPGFGYRMMYPGVGFSFLGWLIPLGLFVLLVLGGIGIFLALRRPSSAPASAMPASSAAPVVSAEPVSAPVVVSAVEPAQASGRVCPHCGKPAQTDWVTCPYCSQPLSSM